MEMNATTFPSKVAGDTLAHNSGAFGLEVGTSGEIRESAWVTWGQRVVVAGTDYRERRSKTQYLMQFEQQSLPQQLLPKRKLLRGLSSEPRKTVAVALDYRDRPEGA